ncbi:MAG: tetratricopeptide repeat protein, partial [Betaproteobacteria bacterium]|nr:tetratricopeptide repeat protein [Betaproteobacteria bacterium]
RGPVAPDIRLGYARSLIAVQANEDALQQLEQLTRQHPGEAPAWLLQGLLQLETGRFTQARDSLSQHVALTQDSLDPEQQAGRTEALMALSQLDQQQGQLEQAKRWLTQISASADPVRVAVRRAELLEQQGHSEEARDLLMQVQASNAEQAQRKTLALSRWLREHRQAQQAYELLKPALQAAPQDHELQAEYALVTEKLQHHEDMETVLRALMRTRPQDPFAYNALGYSLAERGVRLEEARQLVQRALELSPQDPYILDSLGWVEFRLGHHDKALQILQTAYKRRPDAEIAAHIGEVLWTLLRKDEALAIWREGLLLKPNNETLIDTLRRLGAKP